MNRNVIEAIFGAVILIVAAFFLIFAYKTADIKPKEGYIVQAKFNRIDGLRPGDDVRIGGIKIGSVIDQKIDKETFQAVVDMSIDPSIKLPLDTSARILTEGLLGGTFIDMQPGGEEEMLKESDFIEYTQDSINVVDLLGRFIFSVANADEK